MPVILTFKSQNLFVYLLVMILDDFVSVLPFGALERPYFSGQMIRAPIGDRHLLPFKVGVD